MKPKHTPGPWTIDVGMHLHIRGNLSDRKHMAHEEVVARVYHSDDARLIAAAPEMLEALELLERIYRSKRRDIESEFKDVMIGCILPSLSKARGKS